jgi:aspartate-semialdehyde dehydrogenase
VWVPEPTIGVVGATGAVGTVTLELLEREGYENVRVFASARSAGAQLGRFTVEEATADALSRGDVDLFLFSVGTSASRELVPHAVAGWRAGHDGRKVTAGSAIFTEDGETVGLARATWIQLA